MEFKNLSKKNVSRFKNKNKFPEEVIRDILLFSESRKHIIEKKVLEEAFKKKVYHSVTIDYNENKKCYFISGKIYNPITQSLISTKDKSFNSRTDILNYISACGYILKEQNYSTAFIYIPQNIMIKEYLIEK